MPRCAMKIERNKANSQPARKQADDVSNTDVPSNSTSGRAIKPYKPNASYLDGADLQLQLTVVLMRMVIFIRSLFQEDHSNWVPKT